MPLHLPRPTETGTTTSLSETKDKTASALALRLLLSTRTELIVSFHSDQAILSTPIAGEAAEVAGFWSTSPNTSKGQRPREAFSNPQRCLNGVMEGVVLSEIAPALRSAGTMSLTKMMWSGLRGVGRLVWGCIGQVHAKAFAVLLCCSAPHQRAHLPLLSISQQHGSTSRQQRVWITP